MVDWIEVWKMVVILKMCLYFIFVVLVVVKIILCFYLFKMFDELLKRKEVIDKGRK